MIGITRGFSTLVGAAVAGFLLWFAVQIGTETAGAYWATYGLIAAAGLTIALSQIAGGWTKWGWPTVSVGVLLLGFLPVLVVGGWVLLARQPADFFNTSDWSRDLGIHGVVGDLGELLAAIAFGIGLTFGLTFDTEGRRRVVTPEDDAIARGPGARRRDLRRPAPLATAPEDVATTPEDAATVAHEAEHDPAVDEPLTRERAEAAEVVDERDTRRRFGLRRRRLTSGRRGDY